MSLNHLGKKYLDGLTGAISSRPSTSVLNSIDCLPPSQIS